MQTTPRIASKDEPPVGPYSARANPTCPGPLPQDASTTRPPSGSFVCPNTCFGRWTAIGCEPAAVERPTSAPTAATATAATTRTLTAPASRPDTRESRIPRPGDARIAPARPG